MDAFSTFTPKGLIYIPNKISKKAGFRSRDRVRVQAQGDSIVLKRIPTIDEAAGMLKTSIRYSPEEEERKLEEELVKFYTEKFEQK